jgi:DNA-binding transcriptional LysR family regulator
MLDWNDLRYFLAIHRTRTLSGAGRHLKVDQTTVGRRLAAIEAALGARLFSRQTRDFTLTPAGDAILPTAERVEEAMLSLARAVEGDDARLEGEVRVTTNEAFANRLLLPSLPALRRRHPAIRIEIISDSRMLDLGHGEADIAVRARRNAQENIVVKKIGVATFGLYATEEYLARAGVPATLDDLDRHDLIGYSDALGYLAAARWMANVATTGRCVFRGNTILSVATAASEGVGLAVIPCFLGEMDPALRRVLPQETVATLDVWTAVHQDVQRIARIRAVLRHITDVFRARAGMLRGEVVPRA